MSDMSVSFVHSKYLPLLRDLSNVSNFNWDQ